MIRRSEQKWLLLIGALAVMTLLALPILTLPMGRDQGMYANIGRGILQGKIPFVDLWDIKPPAIYYIYALAIAIFGPGAAALRVIDLLTVPLTAAGLYLLAARLSARRAALLAVVLFYVFYFTETFASLTQSDAVVTLPMTWAVVCVLRAADHPRASRPALVWSAAAGSLCALTLWFKHYYALFVAALILHHIMERRAFPFKEALAFAVAGLVAGGIPLLYFVSVGMAQEMLIVAQGTSQYNAQAFGSVQAFIDQMSNYVRFRWWHWGVLLLLALSWPLTARLSRMPRGKGWRLALLWLLAGLGFVLIQAKGFDTHWLPMLPPLALLAADSASRLLDRLPRRALAHLLAACAISLILVRALWLPALPYLLGQETLSQYYEAFQANDLKPAESLAMVEYLRERVAPGDTLFIWGFRPEVYYLAGLHPATRFIAHFPLVSAWYPARWRQENVATLWAAMPPYVLVLQADYMPWVTGRDADSHTLLVEYTELSNWLAANYAREDTQIGNFLIWRRNP